MHAQLSVNLINVADMFYYAQKMPFNLPQLSMSQRHETYL